jgi:hypothetical protein
MEQMKLRQERWKIKVTQNPDLRSVPVSSPIEMVMNEENECMLNYLLYSSMQYILKIFFLLYSQYCK